MQETVFSFKGACNCLLDAPFVLSLGCGLSLCKAGTGQQNPRELQRGQVMHSRSEEQNLLQALTRSRGQVGEMWALTR